MRQGRQKLAKLPRRSGEFHVPQEIGNTNESASCTLRIKGSYHSLRESEKRVADYVLLGADDVLSKTLLEISAEIGVSEASIMRFCKQLGYSGYSELKLLLAKEAGERRSDGAKELDISIKKEDKYEDIPGKVIANTTKALYDTLKIFDYSQYIKAIKAILDSKRVVLFGVGNSAKHCS